MIVKTITNDRELFLFTSLTGNLILKTDWKLSYDKSLAYAKATNKVDGKEEFNLFIEKRELLEYAVKNLIKNDCVYIVGAMKTERRLIGIMLSQCFLIGRVEYEKQKLKKITPKEEFYYV